MSTQRGLNVWKWVWQETKEEKEPCWWEEAWWKTPDETDERWEQTQADNRPCCTRGQISSALHSGPRLYVWHVTWHVTWHCFLIKCRPEGVRKPTEDADGYFHQSSSWWFWVQLLQRTAAGQMMCHATRGWWSICYPGMKPWSCGSIFWLKKKLVVATHEDFSWYFQQFLGLHCNNYEQMLLL